MRIVFHGKNAAVFGEGFARVLGTAAGIVIVPDVLDRAADRAAFVSADVIVGTRFDASLPRPENLRLFHIPGAGYDSVDLNALPPEAMVCNCFGHEHAIAEYVMAALLQRHVPLADADRRLRRGDWEYSASTPGRMHKEMSGSPVGILGFGHIGKAVAARARAFGMPIHVANRSPVMSELIDHAYRLTDLDVFWGVVDTIVVTLPLVPETRGFVGTPAFARMRSDAMLINVARGAVVDEQALYAALQDKRIGGAVIDTWYNYPVPGQFHCMPSSLPFHELRNVVMTPHMSGWTTGTLRRRQATIAQNIRSCMMGEACENVVRLPA